jgi:hypothetical protein
MQVRIKNFSAAMSFYRQAYRCADTSRKCSTDSVAVREALIRYADAALYDELLRSAGEYLNKKDTLNYFRKYNEAGQFYAAKNIARFELKHEPLTGLVCQSSDLVWLKKGFNFFFGIQKYNDCLAILDKIRACGYDAMHSEEMQVRLGGAMGAVDRTNPANIPKFSLQQYTGGDKYYTMFRKAYLKVVKAE